MPPRAPRHGPRPDRLRFPRQPGTIVRGRGGTAPARPMSRPTAEAGPSKAIGSAEARSIGGAEGRAIQPPRRREVGFQETATMRAARINLVSPPNLASSPPSPSVPEAMVARRIWRQ